MRQNIDEFDNFDQVGLAQRVEKHELCEMRGLAALIYNQSVELSKQDSMFKDAMETVCDSSSADQVETLLRYFADSEIKECFCACLFTCYDLVHPDVALELRLEEHSLDCARPYLIENLREGTGRIDALNRDSEEEEAEEKNKSAAND